MRYRKQKVFQEGRTPVIADSTQGRESESMEPLYHPELEFEFICHGRCHYFIGGTNYELQTGSLAIIHRNEVHNYIDLPGPYTRRITLIFCPTFMSDRPVAARVIANLESIHHLKLSKTQAGIVEQILEEIAVECRQKEPHWESVVASNIERFLVTLERVQSNAVEKQPENDPLIKEIIGYLDEAYAERITLSETANRYDLSPFSLSRGFKRYVGLGFREYLIHRRIVEAKRMLEETDSKIITVATSSGFDNLSTFNRDFKLLTGISPSVYRKMTGAVSQRVGEKS
jgi:AraC-like DNA-binding protein